MNGFSNFIFMLLKCVTTYIYRGKSQGILLITVLQTKESLITMSVMSEWNEKLTNFKANFKL